ncbi:Uracil-DNA glycosylase [Candidatus Ruthia magnifica str. Cm (Calyptogena magnifica)]|uniref:Uracil-DNA glycosylase n=2 Tax=Candidatus Ruthturnera TaxID=1541743 RepID=A1AWW6_RUTMC|nr:uracil-DNA glycosylase [Candidatus Ruthturnera calyptogenae]ABL02423.1 Uracil-DNA glycosylase [Candidatus Ruthia magnifica str. Cm (Calyptogena magnifica)]
MNIQNWHPSIKTLLETQSMIDLKRFLQQQKQAKKVILPYSKNWFKAFELTAFYKVKIIILGQDPYHGLEQAHGLSFSVVQGVKKPPSLDNIFKELYSDLNIEPNQSSDLTHWATQGVLLLNSVLTVEAHKAASHANQGWEVFTDSIIKTLSEERQHLVFILWGAYAQKKAIFIDKDKHLILTTTHPSPLSAYRGFLGCRHFSKANDYLKMHNQQVISWS